MKHILLTTCLTIIFFSMQAQRAYDSAVGARLGYPISLSYKKYISEANALEANLSFSNNRNGYGWIGISGAYLHHKELDIEGIDNLNWYFGGGGSVLFWNYVSRSSRFRNANTAFSIDGYIGIEYTFEDLPLNITVDWTPSIFINGFIGGFGAGYGAIAVRYVLD